MNDHTWPPPSEAGKPTQPPKKSHQKTIDLIGGLMVAAVLLWFVIYHVVWNARTNAGDVANANRRGVLNAKRWDRTDPGWRKHWGQGPPRRLAPSDETIVHWTDHLHAKPLGL